MHTLECEQADKKSNGGDVVIGIDLGTTNSCVAIWRNETIEIIPNSEGRRTTPSIIGFLPDGQRIVGDAAKSQAASNPSNTVYDVKRLIGRCVNDQDVVKDVQRLPYEVTGGGEDGEKPTITVQYQVNLYAAAITCCLISLYFSRFFNIKHGSIQVSFMYFWIHGVDRRMTICLLQKNYQQWCYVK